MWARLGLSSSSCAVVLGEVGVDGVVLMQPSLLSPVWPSLALVSTLKISVCCSNRYALPYLVQNSVLHGPHLRHSTTMQFRRHTEGLKPFNQAAIVSNL